MSFSFLKKRNMISAVLMTAGVFAVDLLAPLWYDGGDNSDSFQISSNYALTLVARCYA